MFEVRIGLKNFLRIFNDFKNFRMSVTKTAEWSALKSAFEANRSLNLRQEFQNDAKRFDKYNLSFKTPSGGTLSSKFDFFIF